MLQFVRQYWRYLTCIAIFVVIVWIFYRDPLEGVVIFVVIPLAVRSMWMRWPVSDNVSRTRASLSQKQRRIIFDTCRNK